MTNLQRLATVCTCETLVYLLYLIATPPAWFMSAVTGHEYPWGDRRASNAQWLTLLACSGASGIMYLIAFHR